MTRYTLPPATGFSRSLRDACTEHVRAISALRAARAERMLREVLAEWLPKRLGWLPDHPRLLKLYLRLPHRRRPVIEQRGMERRVILE